MSANITIGAGRVYFKPDGFSGEYLLAQTPSFNFAVEPVQLEVYDHDAPLEALLLEMTRQIKRSITLQVMDVTDLALGLFFGTAAQAISQGATPVTGEALGVLEKGAIYQLGLTLAATGIRGVTAVTVKANGTALALGSDYTLDASLGRIEIDPNTPAATGATLTADFTPTANSHYQLKADGRALTGALRFISDNTQGERHDFYAPSVRVLPSQNLDLKNKNPGNLSFAVTIQQPGAGLAPVYIDGLPIPGLDEGGANAVYTTPAIDGGNAQGVYTGILIDGGNAATN